MADVRRGPATGPRTKKSAEDEEDTYRSAAFVLTFFSAVSSIVFLLVIIVNWTKPCDVPLIGWMLGAVALGLPATYISHQITERKGLILATWFEAALLLFGFVWMAFGTVEINLSTTCETTNPVVWWTVFVSVTFFWGCAVGGIFFMLVIVLIPMFIRGGGAPGFV